MAAVTIYSDFGAYQHPRGKEMQKSKTAVWGGRTNSCERREVKRKEGWKKHKLESRLPGEISITSDTQMTPPLGQKVKRKKPLDESESGEWKSWLKAQHSEN